MHTATHTQQQTCPFVPPIDAPLTAANTGRRDKSTGPTSRNGKAISRRNSIKHGLTANPAAGTIEDARLYRQLLRSLRVELTPQSIVEDLIVQRVAIAAWRLHRCALADSAVWDTAINDVPRSRAEVHEYVERIIQYWRSELVLYPDSPDAQFRLEKGLPPARHMVRRRLADLDAYRAEVIVHHGCAIMAMVSIILEHMNRLEHCPEAFSCFDAEQLAWAMGEDARRLEAKEDAVRFPGLYRRAADIDRLIHEAAKRERGTATPSALVHEVDRRITILRIQAQNCEHPFTDEAWQQRWKQAPFAIEHVLDRLLRYESHAERSLHKNLEAMARIRGVTVQTVVARMRRVTADGTELELQGQQTQIAVTPAG